MQENRWIGPHSGTTPIRIPDPPEGSTGELRRGLALGGNPSGDEPSKKKHNSFA
jgi:hypothetical protein